MAKHRKQKKIRPARIYYGPRGKERSIWWTVTVRRATKPVIINGKVIHALAGVEGVTIGCGLSNTAVDNPEAFPHKAYLAVFTQSTALIVDGKKKNGEPCSAVLYNHRYKHIVDANDEGTLKRMVKEDPTIMEREFTLLPPRASRPSGRKPGDRPTGRRKGDLGKAMVPRGCLQRAVRAGLIGAHVAEQMENVAKAR